MDSGIASDGTNIPSTTLKAKFLELLESNKSALEDLAKLLKINTTLYADKTVQELVSNYEKRTGQLSLKTWRYIFRQLGCLDYFNQHVAADQRAVATDVDNMNNTSLAAKQQPRKDSDVPVGVDVELQGQVFDESREFAASSCLPSLMNTRAKQAQGAIPKTRSAQQQNRADFSANQVAVSELELNVCNTANRSTNVHVHATTKETVGNIKETDPSECPQWSLPPPEKNPRNEKNATSDAPKGNNDQDSVVEEATESGLFSVEDNSHESHRMPSNIPLSSPAANVSPLSLVPEVDEPADLQWQNAAAASEIEESEQTHAGVSSLCTGLNQQSDEIVETPSRPTTSEAVHSLSNPLSIMVGHHRSVAGACPPGNGGPDLNNCERGIPAEHYDTTENNGLLEELLKENESLHLNISFLVQKLRVKETECADVQTQCYHLQRELEEFRGECAQQQVTIEELTRRLEESTVLEAESQRLIRMSQEICNLKEQKCDRLEQHIRQMDQRYDSANCRIENLRRENQEVSEELRLVVGEVQELLQEREQNLQEERERVRVDSERMLDQRMAEVSQAFHNAETDEVKILKQKLMREKRKRKKTEERNKNLLKKIRQLQALSKKEGDVSCGDTCEDGVEENHESNSASSSEEETDKQAGSSTYDQQQDSSEDSG